VKVQIIFLLELNTLFARLVNTSKGNVHYIFTNFLFCDLMTFVIELEVHAQPTLE